MRRDEVSGLGQYAETIWTVQSSVAITDLAERACQGQRRDALSRAPQQHML
jgi:hypothetical protein